MNRVLNSSANSGPSVGASSLVTDANSSLSGGPHLQRSASISTDSYLRLPASPMSFSSNNVSMDGSCIVQQSPNQEQNPQQIQQRQQQQGAASTATSHPTSQAGSQDPAYQEPLQKKPRLDIRQEDILQQQFIQQLLQKRDSIQLQGQTPHLQALTQQKRLLQQQQMLQSLPQFQRMQLQQQQQLRQQIQYHGVQPVSGMRRPYDSGICARRLMQYMYHQRHRPTDNNILYWRKFVAEYFAPCAKKRWCLSLYDTSAYHSLGIFAQAALDAFHCNICCSKSGRGFETTFEVLPRLTKIEFDSGVVDELLFVDSPQEVRLPSGIMMLEYGKAVQESVYDQLRVVREGHLCIFFAPDLKILSWEFCVKRHEELLLRRLLAPQVSQLALAAQKYQIALSESGSAGISAHDLQTNCNTLATVGQQLAKSLDSQLLNDLGFSKRYIRCLQISEVVSSMKDLMAFSEQQNMGPIESLKNYPRLAAATKFQKMKEGEPLANNQAMPNDSNTQNKVAAMSCGVSSQMNNNQLDRYLKQKAEAAALNNYQRFLRQESMKSNQNALQQDASRSFNVSNQPQSFQGHVSSAGPLPTVPGNAMISSHQQPHLSPQNPQPFHANQHLGQHEIQQLLQEMTSNNGVQQQPRNVTANGSSMNVGFSGANGSTNMLTRAGIGMVGHENNTVNALSGTPSIIPSRSNSFKNAANSSPSVSEFNLRPDMAQNINLGELVSDLLGESAESMMFDGVVGDMGCGWK